MAAPPIPGMVRQVLRYQWPLIGEIAQNVTHYFRGGNTFGAAVTSLHGRTQTLVDALDAIRNPSATAVDAVYTDLSVAAPPPPTTLPIVLGVGTATTALPPQCAAVISLRTADGTRKGRGRIYVPFLPAGGVNYDSTNGALALLGQDLLADAYEAYADGLVADGVLLSVYSRSEPTAAASLKTVTQICVDRAIDTQQRRRRAVISAYDCRTIS